MVKIFYGTRTEQLNKCLFGEIRRELAEIRRQPAVKGPRADDNCGFPHAPGNPQPGQVLLIVPAQFTLDAERMAFDALGGDGFFDFHIMSGNKFRQDILRQTGGPGKTPINGLGRAMLLRTIAGEKGKDLTVFRSICEKPEFLQMAGDFIVQMKQNRYDAADLPAIRRTCSKDAILGEKLSDMEIICGAYENAMSGKFTDSEDLLRFTTERVKESPLVRDSFIWFYDFYSFTPSEIAFLGQLMAHSRGLRLMLTHSEDEDSDSYPVTARTMSNVQQEALRLGQQFFAVRCDTVSDPASNGTSYSVHTADKETSASAADTGTSAADTGISASAADSCSVFSGAREYALVRCSTPYTMAETIAAEILKRVREGSAACDEIAILTGDMEGCGTAIRHVFAQMGIPLFMDEKRSIIHDPAVGFLSCLLDIAAGGMAGRTVIAMLKTGLLDELLAAQIRQMQSADPTQPAGSEQPVCPVQSSDPELSSGPEPSSGQEPSFADLLSHFENYIKLYHLDKDRFFVPLKYGKNSLGEDLFARLEQLRAAIAALLEPFLAGMHQASTVREKTEFLYCFLAETLRLPETLDILALQLNEKGLADASEEIAQIWGIIIGLMDQAVELMGDAVLSDEEFQSIYENAFADIKVGLLPQQEGRVTLGTVKRSKLNGIKVLFLAGANEGLIPAEPGGEALLTEDELDFLAGSGYVLSKRSDILAEEERLNLHKAIEAPSDFLWIGYTMEDNSGNGLRPSGFVLDLIENGAPVQVDIENAADPMAFLSSRSTICEHLGEELRACAAGEMQEPDYIWKQCYNLLRREEPQTAAAMASAVLFDNKKEKLSTQTVQELFADRKDGELVGADASGHTGSAVFSFSPSRLEKYGDCAFGHFVRYGLGPEEPREFGLDSREIGSIYHDCLMTLSQQLTMPARKARMAVTAPGSPWMTVTEEEVKAMVEKILDDMAERTMEGLMNSGPEEKYRSQRIRSVAARFAWQMVQQLRRGHVDDMAFEMPFGLGKHSPLEFETSAGRVKIYGRIDRADFSGPYVKIIDYKSGKKTLDREELEKGYALQLMVYLESALSSGAGLEPAGMFYYRISDQPQEGTLEDIISPEVSDEILNRIASSYRLNGLFVSDPAAVTTIDTSVFSEASPVIDARPAKDGGLRSSSALTMDDFNALRVSFKDKLAETIGRLNSGNIESVPRRKGQGSVCDFCDYKGICIFDTAFGANYYK